MAGLMNTNLRKRGVDTFIFWPGLPALVLALVSVGLEAYLIPAILTTNGLMGFASSSAPLVFASLGQAIVITTGGIDLSLGPMMGLVNVLAVVLIGHGWVPLAAFIAGLGVAILIGVLNGLFTVNFRVNPLLATFAASYIVQGVALWLLPAPGGAIPSELVLWFMSSYNGIPVAVLVVALAAALWGVIRSTNLMIDLRAVGGNRWNAYVSGVNESRVRAISYVLAAIFAGLGGIVLTLTIGSGDPLIGAQYTLKSVAAAVIGGVSILGGTGDAMGALFGAVFLVATSDLILGFGISPFYQQLVVGIIILLGMASVAVIQRIVAERRLHKAAMIRGSRGVHDNVC